MTATPGWKHTLADAYANRYGEVARDFLSLVVGPSLAALVKKEVEIAAQEDQMRAAFHLHGHRHLISKTSMALCLGIQSLWEQQLRDYLCNCGMHLNPGGTTMDDVLLANWGTSNKGSLNQLFTEIRGLRLEDFQSYQRLDKLQLLANLCRHGEGPSAEKLRTKHPELWPRAMLESQQFGIPLRALMPVDGVKITVDLLRSLVNAVVLFWLDIRIASTETLIPENKAMIEEVARLQALRPALL